MEVSEKERTETLPRTTPLSPPEGVVAYAHEWSARGRARVAMLGLSAWKRSDLPRTPSLLDRLRAPLRSRDPNSLPPSAERALHARIDAANGKTLHLFGLIAARQLLRTARRRGMRLLVSLEEGDLEAAIGMAPLFEIAERLLVPSRAAAKRLEAAGCHFRKVIVAPYGVQLRPMRPRRSFQRGLLRAVTVARLVPHEGVRGIVEAAALARRMGAPVELHVVGEGPERGELARQIERAGLGETVRLEGALGEADRAALLDRSDLLICNRQALPQPELHPLPEGLLEAMASGLCVIAPHIDTIDEVVSSGVTGLLFQPGNPRGLLRMLLRAGKDPGLRIALGAASRVAVELDFDEVRTCRRLHELYADSIRPR